MNNLENPVALISLTSLIIYTQLIPLFIASLVREGNNSNSFFIEYSHDHIVLPLHTEYYIFFHNFPNVTDHK